MTDDVPATRLASGTVSRDAAWSLAYTGAVRLSTLGVSIAIARLAGPVGTGALGVALQVTALGSMLAAFNLPQSLARHLASNPDPRARGHFLKTSARLLFGVSAATGLTLMVLSGWLASHVYRSTDLSPVLFWCGPLVVATAAVAWVEGALQGLSRFSTLTRWGALVSALDLTLGLLAAWFGVVGVLVTRAAVRAVAVAGAIARWFRADPTARGETDPAFTATAGPLLGFAGPTLLAAGTVVAAQTVLRLLLVRWSSLEAAGQFQAADSVAQGLMLIPGSASIAFMRSVASGASSGYAGLPGSLQRGLERITGFNLPLCLAAMGVVPWATAILFGREFDASRPVLVLLGGAYGLMGPCAIFGAALLGRGEVWIGAALNLMWAIVVLGGFALLGAPHGAVGAAAALAAGYLLLLAVCICALAPRWSIRVSDLAPSVLVTIASLGIAAALALSPRVPQAITVVACLLVGLAVFARWGLPSLPNLRRHANR
jgi:O-antigen/teichoic acid export membrane protein